MIDRRTFLVSAAALAALNAAGPASPRRPPRPAPSPQLNALMERAYADLVLSDPETLTSLGLDTRRARRRQVAARRSLARGPARRRAAARAPSSRRCRRSRATASPAWTRSITTRSISSARSRSTPTTISITAPTAGPSPIRVSQLGGTYRSIPDFLDSQHSIETAADAEAYLSRLSATSPASSTMRPAGSRAEYAMGVDPARFRHRQDPAADGQHHRHRRRPQSGMTTSLARRAAARNIAGDWAARAARIVERRHLSGDRPPGRDDPRPARQRGP